MGRCSTQGSARTSPARPRTRTPDRGRTSGKPRPRSRRAGVRGNARSSEAGPGVSSPDPRSSPHRTFHQEKPVLGGSRGLQPRRPLPRLRARGRHACDGASTPGPASTGPCGSDSRPRRKVPLPPAAVQPEYRSGDRPLSRTLSPARRRGVGRPRCPSPAPGGVRQGRLPGRVAGYSKVMIAALELACLKQ